MIPPKGNRKKPQLTTNTCTNCAPWRRMRFLELKQWRGVATRYARNAASFLDICQIRASERPDTGALERLNGFSAPGCPLLEVGRRFAPGFEGWSMVGLKMT